MRERLVVSVFLAFLVHFILLLVLQLVVKFERSRIPEYSGPLFVTLGETPDIAPVVEKAQEPRQLPRMEREQPQVEQRATDRASTEPASESTGLPRIRSVPTPKTTRESAERPRTGLRFLEPETTPSSDERYLPPDEQAYQTPPAESQTSRQPVPAQVVPAPRQSEVKPQEQPDQPSVLDLRRLDSSLSESGSAGTQSGSREGAPASQPGTGAESTSVQEGREGIVILWDDPSQGREPTSTPRPQIPAWVSEQGVRLQVVVSFVLTPQGVLRDVKVEQSSGYSDVDTAVLEALRRWKFRPVSSTRTVTGRVPYTIIPR
ncbi:MAG: TonB family protein [Spirochaetaceae bacterium]|nr:MAG: TonB family protein [Spirochaetaceae bacterium]